MRWKPILSSRKQRRFRRALTSFGVMLSGVGLGILGLAFFLAGEIYEYQDSVDGVHLPQVDAIVCLAGGRGRIAAASDLWYRYWEAGHLVGHEPPTLYISGMGRQSNWGVLLRQIRAGVRGVIKPENVVLETESSNTEENAIYLGRYAVAQGWKKILLVTSSYHMKRARLIFDRILHEKQPLSAQIETLSVFQDPFEPGEWRTSPHGIHVTMLEYFKWIYAKTVRRALLP